MANTKSATKRARQALTRRDRNQQSRKTVRTMEKKLRATVTAGKNEEANELLKTYTSLIGKAAQKGFYHKNTASRKIGQVSALVNTSK